MTRILFFIACIAFSFYANAASNLLSPEATISLLTEDPGDEGYTTFGHSAIRVNDPRINLDIVFNYGTFDFSTPHFYQKFVKRELDYFLGINSFENFMLGNFYENQGVVEQVFNLNDREKQKLFYFLRQNALPENKFYRYDFFFDNCATRIRDAFYTTYGDSIVFKCDFSSRDKTFRNLLSQYTGAWLEFGFGIICGIPADKKATSDDYMFLPDYLAEALDSAVLITPEGEKPLVLSKKRLTNTDLKLKAKPYLISPAITFWGLLVVVVALTYLGYRKSKLYRSLDVILLSASGLVGLLIVFVWFGTDHTISDGNINLLWAWPLHIPMSIMALYSKGQWAKYHIKGLIALCILLLLGWFVWPQQLHPVFLPIILTFIIRYIAILYYKQKLEK